MSRFALPLLSLMMIVALIAACQPAAAPSSAPAPSSGQAAPTPQSEACKITFGAAVSLTGKTAKEGGYVKDGYELFKDEINKAGGFKVGDKKCLIDIKYYDDASDPDTPLFTSIAVTRRPTRTTKSTSRSSSRQ